MSLLIDKVRIKNFRALKDVEVNLQPTTILVGTNNSGKTTFLQALNIALGVNKRLLTKDDLFIDKDGKQNEKNIIFDLRIVPIDANGNRIKEFNDKWEFTFGFDADKEGEYAFFAFRTEIVFKQTGYESNFYALKIWGNPNPEEGDRLSNNDYKAVCAYFLDAQRDLEQEVKLRTSYFGKLATQLSNDYSPVDLQEIEDSVKILNEMAIDKSVTLSHLKTELSKLNQTTQITGEGVSISPFPLKVRDLHKGMSVHFQDNHSDNFSLEYHGMGTRSWASILSFSAFIDWEVKQQEEEGEAYFPVLLLEEPEAHLHPNAQRTLYTQLKNIKGQKIISTHSPYIAGQAELEEIRCFEKSKDQTVINQVLLSFDTQLFNLNKRKNELTEFHRKERRSVDATIKEQRDKKREFLRKYKSRIRNLRGELFFSKAIIFCEGETEEQVIPLFAQKYFGCSLHDLGILIIGVDGYKNYIPYISIIDSLNIPWFIFSDGEKKTINDLLDDILLLPFSSQTLANIVCLPTDTGDIKQENFEKYIFRHYPDEVKKAIKEYETTHSYHSDFNQNKHKEIDQDKDENILSFLDDKKTKIAPLYTEQILSCGDIKRIIPPLILELFDCVARSLNIYSDYREKWEPLFDLLELIKNSKNEEGTIDSI